MKTGIIIFISSLILQIFIILVLSTHYNPEIYEYESIAINLLTKRAFICQRLGATYHSLVPPLYPLLCATIYLLTNHSHLAMLITQAILVGLTCVIVYLIGKNILNEKIGIISAIICIFHPALIIYSTVKLHELSLVTFIFSLLILMILKYEENLTYRNSLLIGILIGLCILTRATIILFIPLFLIWLWRKKDTEKAKEDYRSKAIFIIFVAGLVILPWIIRNYYIHRKFVFMQTPSVDFWVGNNINATGSNYLKNGRKILDAMPKDFINRVYTADELTKDKIFKEAVYKFANEHPYKFIFLFFKKLYYFWWFSPQSGIRYPYIYLVIYKILYFIILFFAILGVIFVLIGEKQKTKNKTYLLLLYFLAISVVQSIFYVEGRHRWAIEPLLLIFTAYGLNYITHIIRMLKRKAKELNVTTQREREYENVNNR